ncbi:hypothetical protein KSK37_12115 [Kaistella sp. DKR-2]|uniref:hypothetical protein n=1 Tax=Kaistella soli TaxID=2849654 RepID=UPI001C2756FC|nr:hypothetical protein [Kaistella soli]MBU8883832.1 hypothetical protein [Kaistella soli]
MRVLTKLIFLFNFLCPVVIYCQVDFPVGNNSIDPLIRNVETSPTLNNGLSNAGVNIYNIDVSNVSIPIRLNYNGRGVRVNEVASEVGLGWNLSIPYRISRQVYGKADDSYLGYLYNSIYQDFFSSLQKRQEVASNNSDYDFIPDKFYFSLPGKQGSFIFNWEDKAILQQKFDDLKIKADYTDGVITKFEIIDEKGYKYIYGNDYKKHSVAEQLVYTYGAGVVSSQSNIDTYYDSWYLNSITIDGIQKVTFEYQDSLGIFYDKNYDITKQPMYSEGQQETYFTHNQIHDKLLSKITFPSGSLDFTYSDNRPDLIAGNRLEEITLFSAAKAVKKYSLHYFNKEFSDSHNTTGVVLSYDPSAKTRMFLSHIDEIDISLDTAYKTTSFKYSNINLPDRFSNSIDMYGYFNGATNGYFLDINGLHGQVNRKVNETLSLGGILEEIKYPGGLTSKFTYEHNEGISAIQDADIIKVNESNVQKYFTISNYYNPNRNNCTSIDFLLGEFETEVVIPNNVNVSQGIKVDFKVNSFMVEGQEGNPCDHFIAQILDEQNVPLTISPTRNYLTVLDKTLPGGLLQNNATYKLKVTTWNCTQVENVNFSFAVSLEETRSQGGQTDPAPVYYFGEGKRIAEIAYLEDDKVLKKFKYQYVDGSGRKSGIIIGYPYYFTILGTVPTSINPILDPYGIRPGSPLSSYNINSIIYNSVIESIEDNNKQKGKTEYTYSTYKNGGGKYYRWPYFYPADNEWLRGLPLTTTYFKSENGTFERIKSVENFYRIGKLANPSLISDPQFVIAGNIALYSDTNRFSLPLARLYYDIEGEVNPSAQEPPEDYRINPNYSPHRGQNLYYKPFYFTGGRLEKEKTEVTDYFDYGKLTTTTQYYYINPQHFQLTSENTRFSDFTTQENIYRYAYEEANQFLIDKNMIGIPLKTEVKKNDVIISKTETKYPVSQFVANANTAGLPLPYGVDTRNLQSNLMEMKVSYDKYDEKGNLLQYTTKSGGSVAIIWGYNQTQPIAKIEGATYAQVSPSAAAIIDASEYGDPNYSETKLTVELDTFRKSLPTFQITTYTYKPLIGVTTITPPSGIREIYKYDTANRLRSVTDVNGNILKEYSYQYKQ